MKKNNETVQFDFVREALGNFIKILSERVGEKNAVEISFFTLEQALFEEDKRNFNKIVELVKNDFQPPHKQTSKRKTG